jgi:hypothetical protein
MRWLLVLWGCGSVKTPTFPIDDRQPIRSNVEISKQVHSCDVGQGGDSEIFARRESLIEVTNVSFGNALARKKESKPDGRYESDVPARVAETLSLVASGPEVLSR